MNEAVPTVTVTRVANGYLVQGAHDYRCGGPSNGPTAWFVFETFAALSAHLAAALTKVQP